MFNHQQATRVLGLIDKAILEKDPEYIYQPVTFLLETDDQVVSTCLYVEREDGEKGALIGPACLVGHVLVYDGMPLEELAMHEGGSAYKVAPYEEAIAEALSLAQGEQDRGGTWAEARAEYVGFLRNEDPTWTPR